MPRTGHQASATVRIELSDRNSTYRPGDTINGYVVSDKPADFAGYARRVHVSFFGRVKTKYVLKRQHNSTRERGRVSLFDKRKVLTQDICGDDHHAWKFSFTIPETAEAGIMARGDKFDPEPPFLGTRNPQIKGEADVSKDQIPPIMYYMSQSDMSGKTIEAYVEYVLVANVGTKKATYPLQIRRPSTADPISDFQFRMRGMVHVTKTPRLLPEFAEKSLTMGQRLNKLFASSKVPRYTFAVRVVYPTVIQLEHPDPFPFKVFIFPHMTEETTIDKLPPVEMTSASLKIGGLYTIRTKGTYFGDTTSSNDSKFEIPLREMEPITVPTSQEPERIGQKHQPTSLAQVKPLGNIDAKSITALDLGRQFSILVGTSACATYGSRPIHFKRALSPTFSTYNVHVTYNLQWKLKFACAGDTFTFDGIGAINIVGPSEAQEKEKRRQLGTEGMKKDRDELWEGVKTVIEMIGKIAEAVS